MLGFQMAFDVPDNPDFPERAAFEVARELDVPVTTQAGVWRATSDAGIRAMYDHGFMTPRNIYVHAATLSDDSYQRIAATGGSASVSAQSEQSAGQGYPPTWRLRQHNVPVSLSMDTSVWWSGDLFSAMRATLSADRAREHLEAHALGATVTHHHLVGIDLARARPAVEQTVDYLRGQLGAEAWTEGMHPEIPEQRVLENPYTYTYAERTAGVVLSLARTERR